MPLRIAEFREKAAECRRMAEISMNSEVRQRWLQMARDWEELADGVERMLQRMNDAVGRIGDKG